MFTRVIATVLPQGVKRGLRAAWNALLPTESIAESKEKWNRLARENARYFVMTDYGEGINEATFRDSGQHDYETLIEKDALLHKYLDPFPERSVLEIGCGTGRITEFLAPRFRTVSGIDISEEMVREGKARLEHLPNVGLFAVDGLSYPFPDSSFDFVFSFIVFQHMPDEETVLSNLRELGRVLKQGGIGKIQLRGLPTSKKNWFYGPSFSRKAAGKLLEGLPLSVLKSQGENERYFWLWLKKD